MYSLFSNWVFQVQHGAVLKENKVSFDYSAFCFDMEPYLEDEIIFFNVIGAKDRAHFFVFI